MTHGLVVAVDGGGSKTDAVALRLDGTVVAHAHGPGSSPHFVGVDPSAAIIDEVIRKATGGEDVAQLNIYLSGLDLPVEVDAYRAAIAGFAWAGSTTVVENDLYALLRAGTAETDAVAVVCGTGVNAVGVRTDGAVVRFPALGPISGDWGGGSGLGEEALWYAARDVDGRGAQTALTAAVLETMHADSIDALVEDLHFGRRAMSELAVVAPAVFEAARGGDPIAIALVDRQAAEVIDFARACLTRLGFGDREIPVVLGGGLIRAGDPRLLEAIVTGLAAVAPNARPTWVSAAPIVGAALLALESAGADPGAVERARATLIAQGV